MCSSIFGNELGKEDRKFVSYFLLNTECLRVVEEIAVNMIARIFVSASGKPTIPREKIRV